MDEARSEGTGGTMTVIAFCAGWCRTCRDFRPIFDALAADMLAVRFRWIDIEEEPAIVGDLDIATFPTLGVMRGDAPLYFGPITPQRAVIELLLRGVSRQGESADIAPGAAQ